MLALAACDATTKEARRMVKRAEGPSEELSAIDSLMWRQPDSALAQLQRFVVSLEADSLDEFNGHYCQLLISELLYKNDWGQSNREELLQAVAYFDSLVRLTPPLQRGAGGLKNTPSNPTPNLVFLAARAHYINGVGYYENDSIVQACAEYLKTLEVMEAHFEERELVKKKAIFMTYTYNRLMELFSTQFMLDPAVECGENALSFCRIEPTSPEAVSNNLYYLGKQYDKMDDIDKANWYYGQALGELTNTDNLVYRNIISSKALCDYQTGYEVDSSLYALKTALSGARNEEERLTRFLTIGVIFTEEYLYDTALFYLEPVFNNEKDVGSQIQAAECLRIIYDSLGESEKSDVCVRFLANHKKSEGENKALTSKLEDLFKTYTSQKQERQVEIERENAMKIVGGIIISIAIVALGVIIVVKWRSKTLLKKKQEEADRKLGETERQHREELEAERQTHRMQQAALSGRLKRSNEELRELRDQKRQQTVNGVPKQEMQAVSFNDEPICRLIMERVNEGQFKAKIDYINYKDSALDKQQLLDLHLAVDRHFGQFTARLKKAYPELTNGDLDYCCLYLLGLTDADIAALMQKAYSTISDRSRKLKSVFGSEKLLPASILDLASGQKN